MKTLEVLVGCEETQEVTQAFIKLGHNAVSCDLYYPGAKGLPHYQGDVRKAIVMKRWDIIILHPPCTFTCLSGNRWYWNSPLRAEGATFCKEVWDMAKNNSDHAALEQPKTIMQRYIGRYSQSIQPHWFGHGETKETWLWLWNLPTLTPTNIVDGRENRIWKMSPGANRQRDRSATYPGIAAAFARQWSEYVLRTRREQHETVAP